MRKPKFDIAPLLEDLKSSDWKVRRNAAQTLGTSCDVNAAPPLIQLLQNDKSWTVRTRAVVALGRLGDERAIEPLIAALGSGNWQVHRHAVSALRKFGERAVPYLTRHSQDENISVTVRHALVSLLGETGGEGAIFPLHQQLRSTDVMARISAIMALGQLGTEDALHELLQVLEKPNTLPSLSPPRETPPEMLVFYDPMPIVRKAVVDALSNWNDRRIVAPLVRVFHGVEAFGPETDLFLSATNALRRLANVRERDFNSMSTHLHSNDSVARMAAALSLMWLRDARAMDELKPLLSDEDADVRHVAAWSRRALEEVLSYDQPAPMPLMIQFMLR